ncbi:hypothetical protein EPUL_006309 [Erysiphe pulchra]|uniref:Uncharacterized protein n=1 Tax=Erysiphe pulchra TaxID=225359 RepID=A0A2S4PLC0_9PEZI|nr:hypothetical protein EPUL_006309 [Erysiphe pulchra]
MHKVLLTRKEAAEQRSSETEELNIPETPRPQPPKNQPDDRLFLRLSNDVPLRAYSGYALLDYIKSKLGSDKEPIKNVLPTKSGFVLCPSKGNLKVLEEKISENKICTDALLEKASP